jgi:hypothetical protein
MLSQRLIRAVQAKLGCLDKMEGDGRFAGAASAAEPANVGQSIPELASLTRAIHPTQNHLWLVRRSGLCRAVRYSPVSTSSVRHRYDVMEDVMEPTNRPYVDPDTQPGDAGTEPWADDPAAEAGDRSKPAPDTKPAAPSVEDQAVEGSPADQFLTDENAVSARNEEAGHSPSE